MDDKFVSGNVFVYANRKLGPSRELTKQDVADIPEGKRNSQEDFPLYVKCRQCGVYMDYIPSGKPYTFGSWRCPTCNVKVREETAFNQLDREIKKTDASWSREFGYEDDWT